MKKTYILSLALALGLAYNVHANGTKAEPAGTMTSGGTVAGGFEASGHIVSGAGWQHHVTPASAGNVNVVAQDVNNTLPGVIGAYVDTSNNAALNRNADDVRFFLDEVELDLAKTFGENIRFRTDLDFGSATLYSGPRFANLGGTNVFVEQAFVTANIGVGNGIEFLVGRFNAPFGFESEDVSANSTISRSALYRSLRPHHFTGAKFYYAFSDSFDWHLWAANNGFSIDDGNVLGNKGDTPSAGTRLAYKWGEEGKQSFFGLNGVWGQDHFDRNRGWTWIGDLDFNWWATDNFAIGGEALFRMIDRHTQGDAAGLAGNTAPATANGKYLGGLLNLHYDFSDVWDGTLRYAYTHDINGFTQVIPIVGARQSLTGADQQIHEVALAGNYSIADGAKFRLEGNYAMLQVTGNVGNRHVYGAGAGFAYDF